jgi:hypothetical protein
MTPIITTDAPPAGGDSLAGDLSPDVRKSPITAPGRIKAATGIAIIGVVPTLIARDGGLGWGAQANDRFAACSIERIRNGLAGPDIGHRTR